MNKTDFLAALQQHISDKINRSQVEINQLRLDISSDTKSTAGDKHETSRAMAQLEMEKIGKQLTDYQKQLHGVGQFSKQTESSKLIGAGSLIHLSNGWYFLGLGIGKIDLEKNQVFCISLQSPLGQQLLNKKVGDEVVLPNLRLIIEKIL